MPASPATMSGPVHAVPCAHCGTSQDLRELDEQQLLDVEQGVICDRCGRTSRIFSIRVSKIVVLRQT